MNPLNWASLVIAGLKSIPDIISFLKTIRDLVSDLGDYWDRREKLNALHEAMKQAKNTGDTSGLEQFFKGGAAPAAPPQPPKLQP